MAILLAASAQVNTSPIFSPIIPHNTPLSPPGLGADLLICYSECQCLFDMPFLLAVHERKVV